MNKVCLLGRICVDLELKESGKSNYTKFTLGVNRKFINEDGTKETDFITCIAWGKTAETIVKFFKKGNQIAINGHIQTGSYEKEDGTKVHTTDVVVEEFDFVDKKQEETKTETPKEEKLATKDPYEAMAEKITNDNDIELPF